MRKKICVFCGSHFGNNPNFEKAAIELGERIAREGRELIYGGSNYGYVTILEALQYSLNTVAAQIVDKIGPETSYNYLINKLGVTSLVPDDCAYAPMALGQLTNGITVREMAAAYCSFVNDGVFTYSRTYSLVTDKDGNTVIDNSPSTIQAFSANTAHIMTYMMENAVTSGTGTEANFRGMSVAGKTGTSGEYNDRWFVGCTPYYVAAVWTGYDIPGRVNASGNPAAQIFRKVMQPVHEGLDYKSFTYPFIGENTMIFGISEEDVLGTPTEESGIIPDGGTEYIGSYTVPETSSGSSSGSSTGGSVIIFG